MAEVIVIAYLGLCVSDWNLLELYRYCGARANISFCCSQEGTGPAIFCLVVPLGSTIFVHYRIRRQIAGPLKNLSLEVAASIDLKEGELTKSDEDMGPYAVAIEQQLYGQPCLKASADERGPMPYRRSVSDEEKGMLPVVAPTSDDSPEEAVVAVPASSPDDAEAEEVAEF